MLFPARHGADTRVRSAETHLGVLGLRGKRDDSVDPLGRYACVISPPAANCEVILARAYAVTFVPCSRGAADSGPTPGARI